METDGRARADAVGVKHRKLTDRRAAGARGVLIKRLGTDSDVLTAGGVDKHRPKAIGRVAVSGVVIERSITGGRIEGAGGVVCQRI